MILVINSGSSSIKYKLFDAPARRVLAKGIVDRIGTRGSRIKDHNGAIKAILDELAGDNGAVLKDIGQIRAVGHRVVHGGERFHGSRLIDKTVISAIREFSKLAPLHNPPNLLGILACRRYIPRARQVAVFDTAYYQTMDKSRYIYPIPYALYKKERIRRYGFHGTSHKYVAIKTAEALGKPLKSLKIITCHLGNGCSVTATMSGKAVDTSMGFTPLEGLVMGTRSGSIDPAIPLYLIMKKGMSAERVDRLLNNESGLLGISGVSSDMRDVYKAIKNNKRAALAYELFIKSIQKYIGMFAVSMDGVDAITFTGGIGENHAPTRREVARNLRFLGARIDSAKNSSTAAIISKAGSKVKLLAIRTDEEVMIARETKEVLRLRR